MLLCRCHFTLIKKIALHGDHAFGTTALVTGYSDAGGHRGGVRALLDSTAGGQRPPGLWRHQPPDQGGSKALQDGVQPPGVSQQVASFWRLFFGDETVQGSKTTKAIFAATHSGSILPFLMKEQ